ncbi:EscE/YscE/SsaE family type III secretion system needle protein co-chaperone [Aeromonas jandaei]|uniref:EscE/YscE/SsaE family type III secretion system needle protein co-chaperone n=1 Tax=Aeromonas jandaei TaxID=650 RepID=UPI0011170AB0|nr:EscE/YscE/SsaE family type III secretion system needle protein co-chaperone [Aeromonas jandaei]TNI02980.1 EscE/YscE/SsaE family type III secretion system needle protein co-chaperone [Aeromonas jandaei]
MQTLTDLENQLADDPQGLVLRQLIDELDQATAMFTQSLRAPLTPQQYARIERQRQSCLAARKVIEIIWLRAQTGG